MVSVVDNIVADSNAALIQAVHTGDLDTAGAIHGSLVPLMEAIMRTSYFLSPHPTPRTTDERVGGPHSWACAVTSWESFSK